MPTIHHKPFVTRQGCLVERRIVELPNGTVHEYITLSSVPPTLHLPRSKQAN